MTTPGRKRMFMDDDRVQVSLPNDEPKLANVSQYDPQSRKMLVRYEGAKTVDKNWINIKHVERVDEAGKVIPRPSRSRSVSRGRSQSTTRKTSKSPEKTAKKPVSTRTRSKSRERQPTAEFSADEAAEPIKPKAKKTATPKRASKKASSPSRSPGKTAIPSTPKRSTEKTAPSPPAVETSTPLKDAEFSADEEEMPQVASGGDDLAKAAESNSKDAETAKAASPGCGAKICGVVCGAFKSAGALLCAGGQLTKDLALALFSFVVLVLKLTLMNIPMLTCFLLSTYCILFMVDKKNLRLSSFYPKPKLPELPVERMSWTWLSLDKDTWCSNICNIWALAKYPVVMSSALYAIQYLRDQCFGGYKIILNVGKKRVSTPVNLRGVWLAATVATGFVMYAESMIPYCDKLMPFENPVTPVIKSYFLAAHAHAYDGLCTVFRNTAKFYFYLLVLALFKAYQDFDFDLDISWKSWFVNTDDTTSPNARFLVNFGSEFLLQTSFLVLAARNPTNMYLWIIFNSRFVLNWLATRGDTEELSVRRFFQGNNVSGFHFYSSAIFKLFCFTNIWRFISKPERITDSPYRLAAFAILQLGSFVFSLLATKDYPSDKRNGIHGVIRQSDRLAEIFNLCAMTALSAPSFGNVPCWVTVAYICNQLVDSCWQEEAQLVKSRNKWEAYFSKVPQKFIPKVY